MQHKIINQLTLIVDELIKSSDVGDVNYKIRLQENKDKEIEEIEKKKVQNKDNYR